MQTKKDTEKLLEGLKGNATPKLIKSDSSIIRVTSGPGSGKSTGLERRVRRLLYQEEVEPSSIFVGTFTRAITSDLAETLEETEVKVSTIHSLALSLLAKNEHIISRREKYFLLEHEKRLMLYDILEKIEGDKDIYDMEDTLARIQAAKSENREIQDREIHGKIKSWLKKHEAMLINEVVPLVREALRDGDIENNQYDHVIIDEYQDLTKCEQELIEHIWSGPEEGSLVVLGDDNQSIYGFRYNHPEGINGFKDRHENIEDISPDRNWRCDKKIVELANQMIAESSYSKGEYMIPEKDEEGSVNMIYWKSISDEIKGLSSYIKSKPEQDFLVLVPRKFIGHRLSEKIGEEAQTEFNQEALDHPLLQERFTLATLASKENNKAALRAWLGFHHDINKGWASKRNSPAYSSIIDEIIELEKLEEINDNHLEVSGKGKKNIKNRICKIKQELEDMPAEIPEKIEYIFNPDLVDNLDEGQRETHRVRKNLNKIKETAQNIYSDQESENLQEIVNQIRYKIATRSPLTPKEEDPRVRIMTLHSAKGLDAEEVIVAGIADQIIPGQSKNVEEQHRLLYVAATRARNNLTISWPQSISVKDAAQNRIKISRKRGNTARLSKSSLLPKNKFNPIAGKEWLKN